MPPRSLAGPKACGLDRPAPIPDTPPVRPKPSPQRRALPWFVIIAVVAFIIRLIYLVQARASDPLFLSPQMDALYHHRWALAIAAGQEFIHDAFFRAPLYPLFLGVLYKVFGPNLFAVRVVQAMLGSASCGLVYLLARRTFSADPDRLRTETVARIAGFAMVCYPLAIYFDGELLIANLLVFLTLLGLVLLLRSRDLDRQWLLPGLAFGLAAVARPNVLAFVAILPVWLLLEYHRGAWKRLAWLWGAAALVILPVAARNYAVSHEFVPIAWQAGTNFYIGNNPSSDGATAVMPGTRATWWGGYNDVKNLAEQALGRPLKGAEIDRYWLKRGFEFWRATPGKAVLLTLRKLYLWFSGFEVSNNRDIYFFRRYTFLSLLIHDWRLVKIPFGIVLPLAFVGVYLSRRSWRRLAPVYLFVISLALSFIVFFIADRFRMPIVPVALILATYGILHMMRLRGRALAAPTIIAAAALVLLNLNVAGAGRQAVPSQNHYAAAVGLHAQGRMRETLTELGRALSYDSATNILSFSAQVWLEQQQLDKARENAQAAVRLHPDDPDAWGIAGNVAATAGRLDSARVYFEKALALDPNSLQAWNNLGNVALQMRDLTAARRYYEGALRVNPVFPTALFHLGLVDYYEGNVDLAHARWHRVLELDPSYDRARQALDQLR